MYNALPLNLLRFCIEHSDDPTTITNLDPARFDRDPEDYKWLMAALGDLETDSTKALRILEKLKANNMSDDDLAAGLEALQYLVEDIDVAKNVAKQSGIPVIVSLLPHNSPPVRSWSAWILASLSQNNHAIFEEGTMLEVVNLLISLLPKEEDSEALSKQLYVLSSFLSNDSHLTNTFLDNSGLQLVVPWMLHEYAPIRSKAVWLLAKLVRVSERARGIAAGTNFLSNLQQILNDPDSPADLKSKCQLALHNYNSNGVGAPAEEARTTTNTNGETVLLLGPASGHPN